MPASPPSSVARTQTSGTWLVGGMVALGLALAAFALAWQWGQTRRCLAFYGSEAAHRIQSAPRVELWRLDPGQLDPGQLDPGQLDPAAHLPPPSDRRTDVSKARGLVHLRHGLVEDANFIWNLQPATDLPPAVALAFFERAADAEPATVLVVRLDESGGSLEVAGRPGAVTLGRIAAGLRKWLADFKAR